ncbi:hypothetical protein RAB80_016182 [Fusarium oxysporum f. sp. vasinfectum]|nr:hypothetical protein RAB80_016182 [Fusarium oxysporum f. sp. vasinfectum]
MINNVTTIASNFSDVRFTTLERDIPPQTPHLLIPHNRLASRPKQRPDNLNPALAALDETTSTNGKDSPNRQIHPAVQFRR